MERIFGCIIYDYDELILEDDNSERIAHNTVNTWQGWRGEKEKLDNTRQGKIAESAISTFYQDKDICYISYDEFRADGFEKHAPFDGLLYTPLCVSEKDFYMLLDEINDEIAQSGVGQISPQLREKLRAYNVFTVEIKSTRISIKKIQYSGFKSYDSFTDKQRLISEICKDDFLTYPKHTRTGDHTWESYCAMVKLRNPAFSRLNGLALLSAVRDMELEYMDDYYIRVYMDESNRKVLILGYITRFDMMNPPIIKKMILPGKSNNALYLSQPLTKRTPIEELYL